MNTVLDLDQNFLSCASEVNCEMFDRGLFLCVRI